MALVRSLEASTGMRAAFRSIALRPMRPSNKLVQPVLAFTTPARGDVSSSTLGGSSAGKLKIAWSIPYRCHWGQSLGIVGKGKVLGEWDPKESLQMSWSDGDVWKAELEIVCDFSNDLCLDRLTALPNLELEYKYIVKDDTSGQAIRWQDGNNTWLRLPKPSAEVVVAETWDTMVETREIQVYREVERVTLSREDILRLQARETMIDLEQALQRHEKTMDSVDDPSDMDAIAADRVLASAYNKAVAFQTVIRTSETFPRLPNLSPG